MDLTFFILTFRLGCGKADSAGFLKRISRLEACNFGTGVGSKGTNNRSGLGMGSIEVLWIELNMGLRLNLAKPVRMGILDVDKPIGLSQRVPMTPSIGYKHPELA
ncbi:MAG: hypothetical protein M3Y08_08330 [Fibrobacterota bacterium]|nr:hypothetical protein [Fibrobacterota bacterium]